MPEQFVPDKNKGKNVDLEHHVDCRTKKEADDLYEMAVGRLKTPEQWSLLPGTTRTRFSLVKTNHDGKFIQEGDYIRIDVPGPGPSDGSGYDYVQIAALIEEMPDDGRVRKTGIKLRPSSDPDSKSEKVAHFFDEQSSSSLLISQDGQRIGQFFNERRTVVRAVA
ncbi:MAG: hypothetical protein EOP49_20115, partial [Sphingobacteriales bacterium]